MWYCELHKMILLQLSAHSIHFLQSLNVVIFQQWKHWHTGNWSSYSQEYRWFQLPNLSHKSWVYSAVNLEVWQHQISFSSLQICFFLTTSDIAIDASHWALISRALKPIRIKWEWESSFYAIKVITNSQRNSIASWHHSRHASFFNYISRYTHLLSESCKCDYI